MGPNEVDMPSQETVVTEDRSYKPSSPEMPERRFIIETDTYRWDAYVTRYVVSETGTPVYHAVVENEHSAYGLTPNEAVNELAGIMAVKAKSYASEARTIKLSVVKSCLEPRDIEKERIKAAENRIGGSLIKKLFGMV
jgi:hypothetical protein